MGYWNTHFAKLTNSKMFEFSIIFLSLSLFILPISPSMPEAGIDPSWQWVIDYAINHDFRFGRDLIFTYGPLGNYFYPNILFNPDTYIYQLVIGFLLSLLLSFVLLSILSGKSKKLVYVSIASIFVSLFFGANILFFVVQAFFVYLVMLFRKRVFYIIFLYLLIFIISASTLMKFSHFFSAMLLMLVSDIYVAGKFKRHYFFSELFILSIVIIFVSIGQQLEDLIPFIKASFQISTGFSDAMQIPGKGARVIAFLILSLSGFYIFARTAIEEKSLDKVFLAISLAILCFILYKIGFVRNDFHYIQAVGGLLAIYTIFNLELVNLSGKIRKLFIFSFIVVLLASIGGGIQTIRYELRKNDYSHFSTHWFDALQKQYADAIETIKTKYPLKNDIVGTVDVYSFEQSVALAYKLDYRPRPIFQSYTAYTVDLIEKNRSFINSKHAADNILFDLRTFDEHIKASMEGSTWLDIAANYQIKSYDGEFLHLVKRRNNNSYLLEKLEKKKAVLDQDIVVPDRRGFIWVNMNVSYTLIGKILKLFYRPPLLHIELTYDDGHVEKYRIYPALVNSGVILSPQIKTNSDFEKLISFKPELLGENRIKSFRVTGDGLYKFAYNNDIEINFSSMEISHYVDKP